MQFVEFFTQMHYAVIILLVLCAVLLIVEAIIPGFGVCGIMGIICGVAAVICEAVFTKSLFAVLLMIFFILLIFTIIFVTFSFLLSKGLLKKTPLVEASSALPEDYKDPKKLETLIGKNGKVTSICKPAGKALIEGVVYPVRSLGENINEGLEITVIEIKDSTILVKTKEEKDV